MSSVFIVNNAIENLIRGEGTIEEAREWAKLVLNHFRNLKPQGYFGFSFDRKGKSESMKGVSANGGEFNLKSEGQKKKWSSRHKERCGHYKLYITRRGRLQIEHFWASDEGTRGLKEQGSDYELCYDPNTLEPHSFTRSDPTEFTIGALILVVSDTVILWAWKPTVISRYEKIPHKLRAVIFGLEIFVACYLVVYTALWCLVGVYYALKWLITGSW